MTTRREAIQRQKSLEAKILTAPKVHQRQVRRRSTPPPPYSRWLRSNHRSRRMAGFDVVYGQSADGHFVEVTG